MMPERFAAFIRDVGRIASAVGEERQHEVILLLLLAKGFLFIVY